MAHHNDTDGFLGTTYISHGDDHQDDKHDDPENDAPDEKMKSHPEQSRSEATEIEALEQEIRQLESHLQSYEVETDERLQHLEHLAGHSLSPEEKVFGIQEDS